MPNLNLEAGQTWRTNLVIVFIDKIEHDTVYYTQRSSNANDRDVTTAVVPVVQFQDWIVRRNAKFVKPEKAEALRKGR